MGLGIFKGESPCLKGEVREGEMPLGCWEEGGEEDEGEGLTRLAA